MFTICLPASIGTFYDKSFLAGLCTTCNRLYKLANVLYDTREWLNPSQAISVFLLCFSLLLFLRENKDVEQQIALDRGRILHAKLPARVKPGSESLLSWLAHLERMVKIYELPNARRTTQSRCMDESMDTVFYQKSISIHLSSSIFQSVKMGF